MSSAMIIGDPHLGKSSALGKSGVGFELNSRVIDQLNILDWALNLALDNEVSDIIITGDVFDVAKPALQLISLFIGWLFRCTDNGLNVHIINGNHDLTRSGNFNSSSLDVISSANIAGVSVYKKIETINLEGASYTFIPFRDRKSSNTDSNIEALDILNNKLIFENASIDRNNAKISVGHLTIERSLYIGDEIDDTLNELFCPIKMFSNYDYTLNGHIHTPQILSKTPYVSHIGSANVFDFAESNHKKIVAIIDPDSNSPLRYFDIPTRPLKQIQISVPANITDTTSYVLSCLKDNQSDLNNAIARLNITLENPDVIGINRVDIEKCLEKFGVHNICKINEQHTISMIKKEDNLDASMDEKASIKIYADTNIEADIRSEFIHVASSIVSEINQ